MVQQQIQSKCPLCGQEWLDAGQRGCTLVATFPELTWVRCTCGLIYKRSEAAPDASSRAYDEAYFTESDRNSYNKRTHHRIKKAKIQIRNLLEHVPPGPLLDIGCSLGYGLRAANELGLQAVGLDISDFAVEECRKQGLSAERGEITKIPFADETFQMVVMKHILEHTADPRAVMHEVRRVLRPNGGVFISTPNADYNRAARHPETSRFYRPEHAGHDHFIYYTPRTLSVILEEELLFPVKIHPHVILRHAGAVTLLGRTVIAPLHAMAQVVADALALRKEFWLVALKGK